MAYETALQIDEELQRTMYLAAELVGMLRRFRNDMDQSSRIHKEIDAVAQRIEFLIQEHEYTMLGTAEQKPDLIKFGGRPICNSCRTRAIQCRRDSQPAETTAIPPPIWQRSFEFAFACTGMVASEFFKLDCVAHPLDKFPNCLSTLRRALRRLQQLLPPGRERQKFNKKIFRAAAQSVGKLLRFVREVGKNYIMGFAALERRVRALEQEFSEAGKQCSCRIGGRTIYHCTEELRKILDTRCDAHGFRDLGQLMLVGRGLVLLPEDQKFCSCPPCAAREFLCGRRGPLTEAEHDEEERRWDQEYGPASDEEFRRELAREEKLLRKYEYYKSRRRS